MIRGARSMQSTLLKTIKFTTLTVLCFLLLPSITLADGEQVDRTVVESPNKSNETQVIQAFTSQDDIESNIIKIDDQRKRQIMFAMGVPLLIFILITAGLGIAMGIFGKDVYIAHMIFAGLSLTLALGHAIVGLVWFWPF